MDRVLIISALVGIISSVVVGAINMASDTIDQWPGIAKQGLVLTVAVAMVVGLNFFDIGSIPSAYQDATSQIIQALIAALTGIGAHGVKRETKNQMNK